MKHTDIMTSETYISVDIEADGPIPGPHSMLSLGAAAFALESIGVDKPPRWRSRMLGTFSANLETLPGAAMHPKTKADFWDKQPEAWAACRSNLRAPKEAIGDFVQWVRTISGRSTPVFVAYPAGFDFTFVYWYVVALGFESPFSFSALDIKSYAAGVLKSPYRETTKRNMPKRWFPKRRHTHVAVEDAVEQGELFMNILLENIADGHGNTRGAYEDALETAQAGGGSEPPPTFLPIPGLRMTSLEALQQERAERGMPPAASPTREQGATKSSGRRRKGPQR